MPETKPRNACQHEWTMTNVRSGYLVVEGCFQCRNRISFFSEEPVPPQDDYREGDHFWSYLGSSQASKFDLKCRHCSREIPLNDVMALMLCMRCDPECGVYKAGSAGDKGRKTWVYVALCANTSHASGKCISKEGIKALNEYFSRGIQDPGKRIIVVPCELRKNIDSCQGIVLADVGLTEMY
ncbi:MAG: hypothetical protein JXE07_04655 [Candidatus Aminicenantes bacterium]|nr:hypothetical protein [Candidatus Aminicenantes bacterium]